MVRRRFPLAAFALAAVFLGSASFAQQSKPEARPLLVGVVDFGVVFKGSKRKDALEKAVNAKKDALEEKAKAQGREIERLRRSLDNPANSAEWRETRAALQLEIKKAERLRDDMDDELKIEVERLTLDLVDEIEAAVRDYGKDKGYDLILKKDGKGWGEERFQERIFRAQVESVLYCDAKTDLTKEILALVNARWDESHEKR